MKKTMALMMCMSLVLGMTACGNAESGSEKNAPAETAQSVQTVQSEAEDAQETAAAATEAAAEEKDYDGVEFRIAWWGGDARNTQTEEIIAAFEQRYPNLKIDVEYASYGDYFTTLTTQATAGTMPDVYMMDYSRINEFVNAGQMELLDPYIEAGSIDLSDADDSLTAGGLVDGGMYAIATGTNGTCGFYDPAVLEEAGVTLKQPCTWSEMAQVIQEVYDKTGKRAYINPNTGSLQIYMRSIGKDMYAADGAGYGFDPQDMVDYLEYYYDLYESGAALSSAEYEGEEGGSLRDGTGIWLIMTGAEFSNKIMAEEEGAGKSLELCMHPSADAPVMSGSFLKPVMLWGISANSQNKELAADFINYFVNDTGVYDVCGVDRGIPISAAVREYIAGTMSDTEKRVLDYINFLSDGVATAISPAAPTGSPEADTFLNELMEQLQYKQLKKDELLDAVTAAEEQGAEVLKQAASGE